MKQRSKAKALLMCCSLVLINGCGTKRVVKHIPIPVERMDCTYLKDRPNIPSEYVIDWSKVVSVGQAKDQHEAYVSRLRQRETAIAGYIVKTEGRLFACANDAQWIRDYEKSLTDKE